MELKQIKDLMTAMGRTGTKKLRIKQKEFELELEREGHPSHEMAEQMVEAVKSNPFLTDIEHHRVNVSPSRVDKAAELATGESEHIGKYVTSPMVGTFYTSPSPEDEAFVKVGDTVEVDTVVCVIEAMKVMNEIKAGTAGTVAEVLMENGHPIEFGTKLFRIV